MASGDRDSARRAAGATEISCRPADTTSGADVSARRARARPDGRALAGVGRRGERRDGRGIRRGLGVGVHGRGVLGPHALVVGLGVGDRRAGQCQGVREGQRSALGAVGADRRRLRRRRHRRFVGTRRRGGPGGRLLGPYRGGAEPIDVGSHRGHGALPSGRRLRGHRPVIGDRGVQPNGQAAPGRRGFGHRSRAGAVMQLAGNDFWRERREIHCCLCLTTAV